MVTPPMRSIVASPTATPVVVVSSQCVLRRVFVAVLAMIRQWRTAYVFRARHPSGPVSKFLRLNFGVSLPVALATKGNQIAQVIRSVKSSRGLVVSIKQCGSLHKLKPAILALVSIASTTTSGLTFPIRSALARLAVFMDSHTDRPAHRKGVSPTGIRTIISCPDLRRPSLKFFRAMRTLQFSSRDNAISTLALVRAVTGRSVAVIWVVKIPTTKALLSWIFSLWSGLHGGPFYPIFSEAHR